MFGHRTMLQLTDLPVGVLVIFACSSLGVYGIVLPVGHPGRTIHCAAACVRLRR